MSLKKVVILTLIFIFLFSSQVLAADLYSCDEEGIKLNGSLVYKKGTQEYTNFMNKLTSSFKEAVRKGFQELRKSNLIFDHLIIGNWGKFLYDYGDKQVGMMPNGNITIPGAGIKFLGDDKTKIWLKEEFLPYLYNSVKELNDEFTLSIDTLEISDYISYEDFKKISISANSNTVTKKGVKPFKENEGKIEITVHSVGEYFGIQLNLEYVSILDDVAKGNRYVTINENKVLDTFATLVTLKQVNNGIKDKNLYAMTLHDGYGVSMKHDGVVRLDTNNELVEVEDSNIDLNNLVVLTIQDALVVTPLKYKEVIWLKDKVIPTGVEADITDILKGGNTVSLSNGEVENISIYENNGVIHTSLNDQGEFLLYANEISYARLLAFVVSDESGEYLSVDERKAIIARIKEIYKEKGMVEEWKMLAQQLGIEFGFPVLKIILGIILLFGIFLGYKLYKNKKLKSNKSSIDGGLLFDIDKE